jgi:adenylate cyclase
MARIQDLLAEETGAPLRGAAQARLEDILGNALGSSMLLPQSQEFTSRDLTILIADLRGFSAIAETQPINTILQLLRPYFAAMTEIVVRHFGAVDKFMGDSIMALFDERDIENSACRAVTCAVEMQLAMDGLNRDCSKRGMPELHMGIGVNTGTVMAGLVGSGYYSEYVVIGSEVNLASRIEAFALRGQVLISQSAYDRCRDFALTDNPVEVQVKGKSEPVCVREVIAIPSLGKEVPRKEIRRSHRVRTEIPFTYRVVRNKIIASEPYQGRIVDIGYYGVRAELRRELDPYTELKMEIDLSIVDFVASDIYARVLRLHPNGGRFTASIEFTSLSDMSQAQIRRFVQLLVQGSEGT